MSELRANIYLDCGLTASEIALACASRIDGVLRPLDYVEGRNTTISVRRNPDHDPSYEFGRFRYFLEVDPRDDASREGVIAEVSSILHWAREHGFGCVVASGYEEELDTGVSG